MMCLYSLIKEVLIILVCSVKTLNNILKGKIIGNYNQENNEINDFEYIYGLVSNSQTAFISIPSHRWADLTGKNSKLKDGNSYINFNKQKPGLIITEEEYDDKEVPQIIVSNIIDAMKKIALYMRENYKNPLVAITGSNGKSSTRLMLGHLLSDYEIFQNRGNNNTRSAIWLNLCKLVKNPDFALFEISLNALNNRGNMSLVVKPDIAILTNIGEAHLSTLKDTKTVAEFKSRIFEGISENGTIIINDDTLHSDFLYEKALLNTKNIIKYSMKNSYDILRNVHSYASKGQQTVNVEIKEEKYSYNINMLGKGMVENSIASMLVLKVLNINLNSVLDKFNDFKSLPKVMEIKTIVNKHNQNITVIDDTHNASLPSYINAVESFNQQSRFYKGNKVLILGKISDMGDETLDIHNRIVPLIEKSDADYILCIDDPMRAVTVQVKNKSITWYKDRDLMLKDFMFFLNDDSLILFKSSVTDSDLPVIAAKFPYKYKISEYKYDEKVFKTIGNHGKSYLVVDNNQKRIVSSENLKNTGTIEGLNLLIYYIRYHELLIKNEIILSKKIRFSEWPTNDEKYNRSTIMSIEKLLDEIQEVKHPTLTYEFSKLLFKTPLERIKYISRFIENNNLNPSVSVNRTGRFRIKERQSFTVEELALISENYRELLGDRSYIFGDKFYHGIVLRNNIIGCFTSFSDYKEVTNFVEKIEKGEYINEFEAN